MSILDNLVDQRMLGVSEEICPGDTMFGDNIDHYVHVGRSALRCVMLVMLAAGKDEFSNILDLPCGYGRVTRALRAAFPAAALTACDTERDGVDFCVRAFGVQGVYGEAMPNPTALRGPFDLIWCGSLLTHLDAPRWVEFLRVFDALLSDDGVLVFTTHGRRVADWMRTGHSTYGLAPDALAEVLRGCDRDGFGYRDYSHSTEYGISVATPAWAYRQLEQVPALRLLTYSEAAWDNHQDAIGCARTALPADTPP